MTKALLAIATGLTLLLGFAALRPLASSNATEELAVAAAATTEVAPVSVSEQITKGPVVSNVTQHSVSIGWITEDKAPTEVRYSSDGKRWHTAAKPANEHGHVVNIMRLAPNTGYQFLIMTAERRVNYTGAFHTKPL